MPEGYRDDDSRAVRRTTGMGTTRLALWAGLSTAVLSLLIGVLALSRSRETFRRDALDSALRSVKTRVSLLESTSSGSGRGVLAEVAHSFSKHEDSPATVLVIVDPQGRIAFHSERAEAVGTPFADDTTVAAGVGRSELDARMASGLEWSGVVDIGGVPQLAAIAISPSTRYRYLALSDMAAVDAVIQGASLSWWIALGLITLVLVPLPLFLLHRSTRRAIRAEEAARLRSETSEAALSATLESLPFEIWVEDLEHRVLFQNEASTRTMGAWIGKTVEEMRLPSEVAALWSGNSQRAGTGETVEAQFTRSVDGDVRRFHSIMAPVRTERGITGVTGVNMDVTRLHSIERELQLVLRRLDAHVDNSPLALIEWDREHKVVRWSGGAERLFGWTSEEMLGRDILQMALERSGDDQRVADSIKAMLEAGVDRQVVQGWGRAKDGRALHCSWHNSVLRDETGAIVSILSLVQDGTLQHHAAVLHETQERVFKRVLQGTPLSDHLHEFLHAFEQIFPDSRSSVLLVDQDGMRLRSSAAVGLDAGFTEAVDGLPIGPDIGSCGAAAHSGRRVVSDDVLNDPNWASGIEVARAHDIQSCWSQPILSAGNVVLGTFAIYFRTRRTPTAAELAALDSAGSLAGLALERHLAWQLEDTQRETLRMILDERPIDQTLDALVRGIERQIPGMIGAVLLRNPDGLRLRHAAGPHMAPGLASALEGLPIAVDSGTCGHACSTRELTVSADFATDPRVRPLRAELEKHGLRSGWSKPILSGENEVLGTFAMYWRQHRRPGERELALLETASRIAALAIERRMEDELKITHRRVLKMILDGAPLADSLTVLVKGIQAQMLGMRGAVHRVRGEEGALQVLAAPSLPRAYVDVFDGAPYRPERGRDAPPDPPGTPGAEKARIVVEEVGQRPLTASQTALFELEGIRSAWSSPVSSAGGEVLGTFSCYWREAREPSKRESGLLTFATDLAGVALEHAMAAEHRLKLTERLETLHEIGRAILGSDSLNGIAKAAVERVLLQLRCARATVTLFDVRASHGVLVAVASRKATSVLAGPKPLSGSMSHRYRESLQRGSMVEIEDLRSMTDPSPQVRALLREGIRSVLLTPLVLQGRLLGSLNIASEGPLHVSEEERGFLSDVADMLALALEQGRLHEQARTLLARLGTLNEIGRRILEIESPQGIALAALERIHDVIECDGTSVAVFDGAARDLETIAVATRKPSSIPAGTRIPYASLSTETLDHLRSGSPWIIADLVAREGRGPVEERLVVDGMKSCAVTPLLLQNELIGVLTVGRAERGEPEPGALEFLRDVADLLAIGLHQSRLDIQLRANAEEQRRLSERLAVLNGIGAAILRARSSADLLRYALSATRTSIGCPRTSVHLIEGDESAFTLAAVDVDGATRVPAGHSVRAGSSTFTDPERMKKGDVLVVEDLCKANAPDAAFEVLASEGVLALAQIPMIAQGKLLGTLNLGFGTSGRPSPAAVELGREIAAVLAVGLTQMRLHEKIRLDAEQLERRVVERTAEVTAINEELESFVRTVSHDLRAPLRAIQGLGTAVIEDCNDRLDMQGMDYLARMVSAAERMDRMLLDLLAYSRMGKLEMGQQRLDTESIVNEARNFVNAELQSHSARIEVVKPLLPIKAHAATLVQALANLLTNAAKFTAPGVRPRIRVGTEARGRFVRLWVEDNGIGIPREHQERIFKAFERLHGHEQYPGTGIGLAIVRRAAERMGGHAGVESREGEGSRFWLDLPSITS